MKKISLKGLTDFPIEYYTGEPHLEVIGNFECVVDGLKSIMEYSSDRINSGVIVSVFILVLVTSLFAVQTFAGILICDRLGLLHRLVCLVAYLCKSFQMIS